MPDTVNGMVYSEKTCRTALSKSGIPGFDYCMNPYTGCAHACVYCYATFMKKYSGHTEEWGCFVDAKVNLPEVLARDVKRHSPGPTVVGSVCDSYQPIEESYGLTRKALEILGSSGYRFRVLTKSALIVRDIDVLRRFPECGASVTLTTLDEDVRREFEPGASPVQARLQTIRELIRAGIDTNVFLGPLLPYFSDSPERLSEILKALKDIGARHVMADRMNYVASKRQLIFPVLRRRWPEAISAYRELLEDPTSYAERLRQAIAAASEDAGIEVEIVF
jgi:DNA repair photolyase